MTDRNHILKSFDAELLRLTDAIVSMGESALAQLRLAMVALDGRNPLAAQQVIDGDDAIDQRERVIGHEVLRLLALRQPGARDLREVLAALRIAADIERIADHAVNIARLALADELAATAGLPDDVRDLARHTDAIVRDVLGAWRQHDAALAHAAWRRDDELDRLHARLVQRLLGRMREQPASVGACVHWLFAAKHLERIGDHATNIAENVWFIDQPELDIAR